LPRNQLEINLKSRTALLSLLSVHYFTNHSHQSPDNLQRIMQPLLLIVLSIAIVLQIEVSHARLTSIDWPSPSPLQSPALLRALLRARSTRVSPSPSSTESVDLTFNSVSPVSASAVSGASVVPAPPRSTFNDDFANIDFNSIETREPEVNAFAFTRVKGPARFPSAAKVNVNAAVKDEQGVGPAVSFPNDDQLFGSSDESTSERIASSELHPVYMKPPVDFKPVLYAGRRMDGTNGALKPTGNDNQWLTVSAPVVHGNQGQRLPYPYPNGLSSWMLGGVRGAQRGGYWEQLSSNQAIGSSAGNTVSRPWTRLTPAAQSVWFVQSVRDSNDKASIDSQSVRSPTDAKVELVSLGDEEVSDKDAYDASPSTVNQVAVQPPSNQFKFLIDSKHDLMMSASRRSLAKRV
jgi:hypothetical protein